MEKIEDLMLKRSTGGIRILSAEHSDALDKCEFRDQLYFWGFRGEDPEGDYVHECDKEHAGLVPRRFTKAKGKS